MKSMIQSLSVGVFFLLGSVPAFAGTTPEPHAGFQFSDAKRIPILSGGRVKPLDSYAREISMFVTGKAKFKGWDAVELLLSWVSYPDLWQSEEIIAIGLEDVKRQIGVNEKRKYFSVKELVENSSLAQYADHQAEQVPAPMQVGLSGKSKDDPREKELKTVIERITMFRAVVTGHAWTLIPMPMLSENPADEQWAALTLEAKSVTPEVAALREKIGAWMLAYRQEDAATFASLSTDLRTSIEARVTRWHEGSPNQLQAEVVLNQVHPFQWAWIFYFLAALMGVVTPALVGVFPGSRRWLDAGLFGWAGLGTVSHIAGMVIRSYVAGRPPVTNMYESMIWVTFGAIAFAWILWGVTKQKILLVVSTVAAGVGLVLADSAPAVMDPSIRPLVPVLRSNFWLTIHVLTITLGYAAFLLTMALGNVTLFQYLRQALGKISEAQGFGARVLNLNQLAYRSTQFGVVLLAAGTILGGVWADYSWGRFWGWDPKEVWALIALLGYVAILHARYTGWIGQFGFAAWNIVAFSLVVMAWYGVNFVLGAGLHSYGFSSGGQGFVATFTALQLGFVAAVTVMHRRKA